ncbi:MAG: sensor domain-containing diguanylate cyclase [Actinomycetota bacterium]
MVLVTALTAVPSAAVTDDWLYEALDTVLEETILLTELNAFGSDPILTNFVTQYGWGFDTRAETLDEVDYYDDYGVLLLPTASADLSPEARQSLEALSTADKAILAANSATAFMDHGPYLDALLDLLRRRGAAPDGPRDPLERELLNLFIFEYANTGDIDFSFWDEDNSTFTTTIVTFGTTTIVTSGTAPTTTTIAPTTTTATTIAPTTAATTVPTTTTTVAPTTRPDRTIGEGAGGAGGATGATTTAPRPESEPEPFVSTTAEDDGLGATGADGDPANTTVAADAAEGSPDEIGFAAGALDGGDRADGDADAADSGLLLTRTALALAFLAGILALVVARARRREGEDDHLRHIAGMSRKLAGCHNQAEVIETTIFEAIRIAGADHGAYHRLTPVGLKLVGATDTGSFAAIDVTGGALADAASSGQPIRTVVEQDPGLAERSMAVMITPVIDEGRVIGVLTVTRGPSSSFDSGVVEPLAAMAQMLGSALYKTQELETAVQESEVDWLTSLPNRRKFDHDVDTIGAQVEQVGVAMVDIDHFKAFNDTYGHDTGDVVIQAVAKALADSIRPTDVAYRYGGEEFSVLLKGCGIDEAAAVMERVRLTVQKMVLPETQSTRGEGGTSVTVSVGVAAGPVTDVGILLRTADQAMYAAKRDGRNRVVIGMHSVSS